MENSCNLVVPSSLINLPVIPYTKFLVEDMTNNLEAPLVGQLGFQRNDDDDDE